MKRLPQFSCGWAWLEKALNDLATGLNERTIVKGDGITLNEGPAGVIIGLAGITPTAEDVPVDSSAILKVLARDPGKNGAGIDGKTEFIPWKAGAQTGWRKITYLEMVTTSGVSTNVLKDVWSWTGQPFNVRSCDGNTFGGS